jgi:hypothetical protein
MSKKGIELNNVIMKLMNKKVMVCPLLKARE